MILLTEEMKETCFLALALFSHVSMCVCTCAIANNGIMANSMRIEILTRAGDEKHKFNE